MREIVQFCLYDLSLSSGWKEDLSPDQTNPLLNLRSTCVSFGHLLAWLASSSNLLAPATRNERRSEASREENATPHKLIVINLQIRVVASLFGQGFRLR